jgi:hypothetical protein
MCGCGGVTALIFKLDKIQDISASPPGRFTTAEDLRFFIFIECAPEGFWIPIRIFFAREGY